ncbi:MAG TPA: Holliday junction resolvase RuvX [Acholeplasma sp.]|nr:Holliday junction resolvase RuvX [Acholeplasma sp.]
MIYIGLDLGEKTVGIARSDSGLIASTVSTYRFYTNHYDDAVNYIKNYVIENAVDVVVLGYPKHMNNDVGIRAQISIDFKESLEKLVSAKVILWDERLSTKTAKMHMISAGLSRNKQKNKKDELAAQVILQNYLDSKGEN